MNLAREQFKTIDLSDPFFDSLKTDYAEFPTWFNKKAQDHAYVFRSDEDTIEGFLYLKVETDALSDTTPPLPARRRLKVGTMKINPHGTKLGERFLKKIFDHALVEGVDEIYVTAFQKHQALIALLAKYGFKQQAVKKSDNGKELVLVKEMLEEEEDSLARYPLVKLGGNRVYLLSLHPDWHTRLLPDSILKSEDASIVQDVSHSNSIHKVYLTAMHGVDALRPGDVLVIYRTTDGAGPAHYRSVVTSLCVVEDMRHIDSFASRQAFLDYCEPYSVFTRAELERFWKTKRYPFVFRFTYNFAFPKRVTRGAMIEDMGLSADVYWGFMRLTKKQLRTILAGAKLDEDLVVD